ncbi:MAG: PTS sugar transporter subunit IIB [Lachnospiraceae bacterium]|nr:PTS sugar transporter subunit IIB [Lachnospiraceae bacterium]
MVKFFRVDERLLHGQVAVTWVSQVAPTSILIANDEIMRNEIAKMAIKMVKPNGVNLAIRDIAGAVELLKDPRTENLQIFVIVKTVQDALRLVNQVDGIGHINIGGIKKKEGSRLLGAAVYVNDADVETISQLAGKVKTVEFQMVPADKPKAAMTLVK